MSQQRRPGVFIVGDMASIAGTNEHQQTNLFVQEIEIVQNRDGGTPMNTEPKPVATNGITNEEITNELTEDQIDDQLEGTFPASDPLSWTLGVENGHEASIADGEDPSRS